MPSPILPPIGPDWKQWGRQLSSFLQSNLSKLGFKTADDNPSENGVILWDNVNKYPVVSKDGEFVQIILEDGHASLYRTTDVTAAAVNTAYAIQYDAPSGNSGITLDGTDPTKIVFAEAGEYLILFSAQISSTSSSTVKFYFWPRLNGTDAPNNTIVYSLHQNDATVVVSRSAKFDVSAGDYLQIMWAVDSTSGYLDASAATAFSPAAPATTLHITRMHG
jgi:hypothetical protein|tara:strand:- start:19279 stop:19938 length:660 start_codon:yes stop_codon:yes gene_type:complete